MTTENTTAPGTVVEPITGEILDLATATTTDLAAAVERIADALDALHEVRVDLVEEVARRLDSMNTRSEVVGEYVLKTNAPTVESYDPEVLAGAVEALVAAGALAPEVAGRIVKTVTKTEVKVDRTEVNKLKKSADPAILAAVAGARRILPQRRTLKVERTPDA